MTEPEQIDTLAVPDPWGGLNAKKIDWYKQMLDLKDDFDIRLNGEPIKINVFSAPPGGPIPSAFALSGSNMFLWMITDPERMHKLFDIVTASHIQCIEYFDEMQGINPEHPQFLGCDAGEMLSPEMYKEFVVPYYTKIWEKYKGMRGFHMCGIHNETWKQTRILSHNRRRSRCRHSHVALRSHAPNLLSTRSPKLISKLAFRV